MGKVHRVLAVPAVWGGQASSLPLRLLQLSLSAVWGEGLRAATLILAWGGLAGPVRGLPVFSQAPGSR